MFSFLMFLMFCLFAFILNNLIFKTLYL